MWVTIGTLIVSLFPGDAASQGKSGIPECDKYEAMVTACLPKMCEVERELAELELSLHREVQARQIELQGRQASAESCARQIREAIQDDEYGCYAAAAGASAAKQPVRLEKVRTTDTSVVLTLSRKSAATPADIEVSILKSIMEPPTAIYRLPAALNGQLVLDTASASPMTSAGNSARVAPIRLEPSTTYCFAIGSSTTHIYRKGLFTTLPKR
jgi:hypothetical protein